MSSSLPTVVACIAWMGGMLLEIFAYPIVTVVNFTDRTESLKPCIVLGCDGL